jgi:hypothetical protein
MQFGLLRISVGLIECRMIMILILTLHMLSAAFPNL